MDAEIGSDARLASGKEGFGRVDEASAVVPEALKNMRTAAARLRAVSNLEAFLQTSHLRRDGFGLCNSADMCQVRSSLWEERFHRSW